MCQITVRSTRGYECHRKAFFVEILDLYLLEISLVTGATQLNLKLYNVPVTGAVDEVIRQQNSPCGDCVVVASRLVNLKFKHLQLSQIITNTVRKVFVKDFVSGLYLLAISNVLTVQKCLSNANSNSLIMK